MKRGRLVLTATIVKTKHAVGGPHFKGGVVNYGQMRRDVGLLLHDTNAVLITTLLDYYPSSTTWLALVEECVAIAVQATVHWERSVTGSVPS